MEQKRQFSFMLIVATIVIVSITTTTSLKIISKNHESLEIQKGEQMILVCTADVKALACVFKNPKNASYPMIKGAK